MKFSLQSTYVRKIALFILQGEVEYFYWKMRTLHLRRGFKALKVADNIETIDTFVSNNMSLARFGDGEFKILFGKGNPNFQEQNQKLAERLREVILSNDPRVLVCIPRPLKSLRREKLQSRYFWLRFINQYRDDLNKVLKRNKIYGNAGITRFYIGQTDKKYAEQTFALLKEIWDGKDLLIVEGELSRMGVGNSIFDNARSVQRIVCPSTNAFGKYDEILNVVKDHANGRLILIALGPTATVLAYDLALANIRAIDLGHIDLEYCWMKLGVKERTPIKGKHISELHSEQDVMLNSEQYSVYANSILWVI